MRELLPAPEYPTNIIEKLIISFLILSSKSAILPITENNNSNLIIMKNWLHEEVIMMRKSQ